MRKILPQRGTQGALTASRPTSVSNPAPDPSHSGKALTMPRKPREHAPQDRYLSVAEVADVLGTTERFPRRLIEERRIEFKRFGRHVRIAESVLTAYIESCTVTPFGRRAA